MNENKIIHNFTDFSQDYNETEEEEKKANNLAILNKFLNDLCEEVFNNEINFKNETEILLDCDNNSYYLNYLNLSYFDSFDQKIKEFI